MNRFVTVFALITLALTSFVVNAGNDSASAETAYNNYRKAIIEGDLELFRKYIPSTKLKEWESADAAQKLAALKQSIPVDIEINGISASGKKAIILAKSGNASCTAQMVLEQGEWKFSGETWDGVFTPPRAQSAPPPKTALPAYKKPATPLKEKTPSTEPITTESAAVKTAYENYRKAIFAGDVKALKKYVIADKIKELDDDPKEKLELIKGFMPANINITDIEVSGKTATIYAQGTTIMGKGYATIEMILEDNQWKVVLEEWKSGDVQETKRRKDPVAADVPGRIAFVSNRSGQYEIYTINADGTKTKQLTKQVGGGFKKSPVWSPDGTKIAYVADDIGSDSEIYVVEADGSNLRQVTSNDANESDPAWSPDSDKIAFKLSTIESRKTHEDGGISVNYNEPEIFVVYSDGTGMHQLTEGSKVSNSNLAWSPDGTSIAFVSLRKNNWNIYVINSDGSNEQRITDGQWDSNPAWSPDGQKIAFIARMDFGKFGLALINKDGSGKKILTQENVLQKPPIWSPDGSRILFIASNSGHFSDDICIIDADGSNIQRITNTKEQEESPSWSPDGRWICFRRDFELYIIHTDGSGEEHKISDERGCDNPAWSPSK